jgi:peptidoglycan/xylan/chitin deacetylase (PgdA/CDA1 family)
MRRRFKIGLVALALLLAFLALALFRPEWIVAGLSRLSPQVIYSADTDQPVVAITIDDGPDPTATGEILDVLEEHDARATFFLLSGRIPGNEDLINRMVEEDHELANHLVTDEPSIRLSPAEFERQLIESHSVLSEYSDVRWFRPGSGWYNDSMLTILHEHEYRCVLGSVYPFDPQIPSLWFETNYILLNVRPGSIIVLHDYGGRGQRTAATLSAILPELERRGFRAVTLSEVLLNGADQ